MLYRRGLQLHKEKKGFCSSCGSRLVACFCRRDCWAEVLRKFLVLDVGRIRELEVRKGDVRVSKQSFSKRIKVLYRQKTLFERDNNCSSNVFKKCECAQGGSAYSSAGVFLKDSNLPVSKIRQLSLSIPSYTTFTLATLKLEKVNEFSRFKIEKLFRDMLLIN